MSTLNLISNVSLLPNLIEFNVQYPLNFHINSLFIYRNKIRLTNTDYNISINGSTISIVPMSPFAIEDIIIIFIHDNLFYSNLMYVCHGINLINTNNTQNNILFNFAYLPQEVKSNNYIANTFGINSSILPAKEINISFCNEVNLDISYISYSHKDNDNTYYTISVFDKFSENIPDNTYIIEAILN